jgi:hypothetical protein
MGLFETLLARLDRRGPRPRAARRYACRCGQPLFFGNTSCVACGSAIGYEPLAQQMHALPHAGWQRCANFEAVHCNWLVPVAEAGTHQGLCRACRLNRTVPDPEFADNRLLWTRIEAAKRRLVSQLLALALPLASRVSEDAERGLMFDFLRPRSGGAPVLTGHAGGLITLDVEEADDARREQIRTALHEPYRTLLGHLRHEVGHYYWDRLVAGSAWHERFRARFGDERTDYAAALARHYAEGPAPDWAARCVSAYAGTHPWEDWAETWAHYLHMIDTLDTAFAYGLGADDVDFEVERYGPDALDDPVAPGAGRFLGLVNGWLALTAVLNELARSMGQPDFYPFVLSRPAVAKLHFVHRVVGDAALALRR